jgi:exodeoxyribonuclease-3
MRVITLNMNGIRSATEKGFLSWMRRQDADLICLQETRARSGELSRRMRTPGGYHAFFHDAEKPGYSGVAIFSKRKPDRVEMGLGDREIDAEGRFIRADFGRLSVASWYMPSGSASPERLAFKLSVMERLFAHLDRFLDHGGRDLILCGDFNIAHKAIDLRNWRGNQKNPGFLPEERAWMDRLLGELPMVDAFRVINTQPEQYTWWSNRGQAWAKNVGWRLDYQVVTPGLSKDLVGASIYKRRRFSDHAPLSIDYRLEL